MSLFMNTGHIGNTQGPVELGGGGLGRNIHRSLKVFDQVQLSFGLAQSVRVLMPGVSKVCPRGQVRPTDRR